MAIQKKVIYNILKFNAVCAVSLILLGYFIDSDPPYENRWLTVMEFCILTAIVFVALTVLVLGAYLLTALLFKSSKI